ncbi:MAG: DUF4428 domain-containing protein [Erysipelotrichaceae bacterium]|nr:DUF4428 domain-containing protein [Erysipelotrichaceae bacterium]
MGLFDSKYCDICGEKIGLLGNRKLDDGNMCKNCAAKLSPFFTGRKRTSVADIKKQLAYREENERQLADFHPTRVIGNKMKFYVDDENERFVVTRSKEWRKANPDIINLSQVIDCKVTVKEDKDEITFKDAEGKEKSYTPKRYKFEYTFDVEIDVDSPWFSEIKFELTDEKPTSPNSLEYREYEEQAYEIQKIFNKNYVYENYLPEDIEYVEYTPDGQAVTFAQLLNTLVTNTLNNNNNGSILDQLTSANNWYCPKCGKQNTGNFCDSCGTARPVNNNPSFCSNCGYRFNAGENPRYCPKCGKKLY